MPVRSRPSERGFTLIELIVVMVIVAILVAIAVPTFIAQKAGAQRTKGTEHVNHIVELVETCALSKNTDGSYTGCGDEMFVYSFEKSYQNSDKVKSNAKFDEDGNFVSNGQTHADPADQCEIEGFEADGKQNSGGSPTDYLGGFLVQCTVNAGGKILAFQYSKQSDGTVTKTCTRYKRVCPKGTW